MADIGTAVAGFTAILESEFDIPVIDKDIEEDFHVRRLSSRQKISRMTGLDYIHMIILIWKFTIFRQTGTADMPICTESCRKYKNCCAWTE